MQPKPKFETNVKTITRSQLVSGANIPSITTVIWRTIQEY